MAQLQRGDQVGKLRLAVKSVLEHLVMHQEDQLARLGEVAIAEQMIDLADQMIDALYRLAAVLVHPFMIPAIEIEAGSGDELVIGVLAAGLRGSERVVVL